MKLKTHVINNNNKESPVKCPLGCAGWSSNDEVFTVGDDRQILKWDNESRESLEVAKLPDDFIPTDLHWLMGRSSTGKGNDSLLISSNDGRFIILNKSSRVERNISAHSMAIVSCRWSPDGAGLLTASEDGIIKIWSRSGMLRSTVVQSDEAIRCACWSPNSAAIAFCQAGHISIKPLAANSKLTKWRAHDGLVLCLSWSSSSNVIASGGEDCRYKIWDSQGTNVFTSAAEEFAVTSIAFGPDQDFLAVGGFNMLKLCSGTGWAHSIARFSTPPLGSMYALSWSPDGTQIAAGCSSGNLVLAHVVEKQIVSSNLKATTTGRKSMLLQDIANGTSDVLDFPNRVINFALGYGHLIVATSTQIHIFNEKYINTPIIIDGRSDVSIIEAGKKFFVVVDASSIWVYTYTGRLHLSPRYPGSQAQVAMLTPKYISLGLDVLAIRDSSDFAVIHLFDLIPGASRQYEPTTVHSKSAVALISACRSGTVDDQYLAFVDTNHELFITSSRSSPEASEIFKIGTQVMSVMWASHSNILVGLHDSCYSVWYCPGEGGADPTIIALTTVTIDAAEFGKNISLESFESAFISFRCSGALYTVSVNIYCEAMLRALMDGRWQQALKICRFSQNTILWATLAAIATKKNQLQISEEAYSCALQIDKVSYLQYIKNLPASGAEQMAENSLMMGRLVEAETVLLHNKKFQEAIALCIRMHNWKRALEIAEKNQIEILDVLEQRKRYLNALGRPENDAHYLRVIGEHDSRDAE